MGAEVGKFGSCRGIILMKSKLLGTLTKEDFIKKKKGSNIYLLQVKGFLNRVYEIRDLQGKN